MDSRDLTYAQLDVIKREVNRSVAYLHRLRERMQDQKFGHDDPVCTATDEAYFAAVDLLAAIHKAQDHALKHN